jgi:2-deoxy-D-gluconate 3-dehydrogenase
LFLAVFSLHSLVTDLSITMILNAFSLAGKAALVTGAAQGLGQGMALGLAEAGADVAVLDVRPATETQQAIASLGCKCYVIQQDLQALSVDGARAVVQQCVAALGRLDILFNNAGIIRRAPAVDYAAEDWHAVLGINLNAAFFLAQAVGKHCLELNQPGKIVNTASMLSFQGGLFVPSYTAAKSALAGITRALANEWAKHGINVNAIAPGYFETDVTAGIRSDPVRTQNILGRIPAGRWGKPADLKGVAVFLASAASDYLHGSIIPVDGGWLSN